jgi:hypothetical protein
MILTKEKGKELSRFSLLAIPRQVSGVVLHLTATGTEDLINTALVCM